MTSTERITRGACRLLVELGYAPLPEVLLTNKRRVDIVGLNKKGHLIIVEVKSCLSDFRSDQKWPEYLSYCDEFYFAVDKDFPRSVLEGEQGLLSGAGIIIADQFGGEIVREACVHKVNAKRAKTLVQKMARTGALRLFQPTNYCGE